jgi:hypothetical protein
MRALPGFLSVKLALVTHALKGLRRDKEVENYKRTLLVHIACGYSLRENATGAKLASLADITHVALIRRLRKTKDWFHSLVSHYQKNMGLPWIGKAISG